MKRHLQLWTLSIAGLVLLAGCTDAQDERSTAAKSDAKAHDAAMGANADTHPKTQAKQPSPKLRAAQQLRRRMAYEREGEIALPQQFPEVLRSALMNQPNRKLVRVQVSQNMQATRPTPGRSRYEIRWVTLRENEALTQSIKHSLAAAGWTPPRVAPNGEWAAPDGVRVSWRTEQPVEQPSVVDIVLELESQPLNRSIVDELQQDNAFRKWASGVQFNGYEFGLFHATRPGGSYSDLERLALALKVEAQEKESSVLRDTMIRSGFKPDATDGRLLKGPNRTTVATRTRSDGTMVVHYQRRWNRNPDAIRETSPHTETDPQGDRSQR